MSYRVKKAFSNNGPGTGVKNPQPVEMENM